MMDVNMKDMTIEAFAQLTASNEPAPGGGSVSAMAGAIAAALAEMVAALTVGKKKYVEVEEEMKAVMPPMRKIQEQLLLEIQHDTESFNLYMQALSLPKNTDEEKAARSAAMQDGLKAAALVPLSVAKAAIEILPVAEIVVTKGNATAETDGLVATMMARTAVLGALFNVKINLGSIKDEAFVNEISAEVKELEERVVALEKAILEQSTVGKGVL